MLQQRGRCFCSFRDKLFIFILTLRARIHFLVIPDPFYLCRYDLQFLPDKTFADVFHLCAAQGAFLIFFCHAAKDFLYRDIPINTIAGLFSFPFPGVSFNDFLFRWLRDGRVRFGFCLIEKVKLHLIRVFLLFPGTPEQLPLQVFHGLIQVDRRLLQLLDLCKESCLFFLQAFIFLFQIFYCIFQQLNQFCLAGIVHVRMSFLFCWQVYQIPVRKANPHLKGIRHFDGG